MTVTGRSLAILGGVHAVLGAAQRDLRVRERRPVILLVLALAHREVAGCSSLIACKRRSITGLRGRVSLRRALKALRGGLLALPRCALADLAADLVRGGVDAVREVTITGGLIAIGR
ncbi:MAG: hypothetical protein M3071_14955 [Actinomycetota bacterium]|nr:hypothetical protein [Actinomycetota bacterium]